MKKELTNQMLNLDVSLYDTIEKVNSTISKCRVRIFYKGLNRNRTFITEDFAQQLINSLPYVPIKGIFDKEDMDFGDHGMRNSDGRIYGVVPENPNFAWEWHEDCDGVNREYACADVYLFTGLYPEAKLAMGSSQSMEIHREGLKGEWKFDTEDGEPYFLFQEGHLLGLQVLGDMVEPCFEGSAFFSLYKDIQGLFQYLKSIDQEGDEPLDKNSLIIAQFDQENSDKYICLITNETYSVLYNTETSKVTRVYYTENEENVSIGETKDCQIYDLLDEGENTITYSMLTEQVAEYAEKILTLENENNAFSTQIAELQAGIESYKATATKDDDDDDKEEDDKKNDDDDKKDDDDDKNTKNSLAEIEALQSELETYKAQLAEKETEINRLNELNNDINNEVSELKEFKRAADTEKKTSLLNEFSSHLSEETVETFKNDMDKYSIEDFKKELCFAAYNADSTIFNKEDGQEKWIYTGKEKNTETGALKLLNKHRGGNK